MPVVSDLLKLMGRIQKCKNFCGPFWMKIKKFSLTLKMLQFNSYKLKNNEIITF